MIDIADDHYELDISRAERESILYGRSIKEKSGRNVQGRFSGFLEVKGRTDDLSGELSFKVSDGTWESYSFDEIGVNADLKSGTFLSRTSFSQLR